MSCQRSFEIDLAALLAGSSDPALRDFRAHAEQCADCAAEVRAWSALHDELRAASPDGGHPREEQLLAFEDGSPSLDVAARAEVERHLARCASCRDELAALRSFDFAALRPAAPIRHPRAFLPTLRALVVHPAFAYALVVLLLIPTVAEHLPFDRIPAVRESRSAEQKEEAEKPPEAAQPMLRDAEPAEPRAAVEPPAARRVAPAQPQSGGEAKEKRDVADLAKSELVEKDDARERLRQAPPAAPPMVHGFRGSGESEGFAGALSRQPLAAAPAPRGLAAGGGPGARAVPDVAVRQPDGGVLLRIPVRRAGADLEVRVSSSDGRRELREQMATRADGAPAEIRVPAGWLQPGQYKVEVRAADETSEKAAETYGFSVP